jgi:molybdopterin-synthase adenylyltransferase
MLSDAQIERYSRQIVLPEVGAAGQERLLATRCAVLGAGPLAATAARYLVGAGIGAVALQDAAPLDELRLLNPEIALRAMTRLDDGIAGVAVLAADLAPRELAAVVTARPALLVAAGLTASGGWLHVASGGSGCAQCAARAAAADPGAPAGDAIAASVLGAVAALALIVQALGLSAASPDMWRELRTTTVDLIAHPLVRDPACAACGGAIR